MYLKKIIVITLVALFVCSLLTVSAQQAIELPFSGRQFHSDINTIRAVASGRSSNVTAAQNKAILTAKKMIAGELESAISGLTDLLVKETDTNGNFDFKSEFNSCTKETIKQQIEGAAVVHEKALKEGNVYTYWIVMELPKKEIVKDVYETVQNNEKLKFNYDKKSFEDIFNEEMRKLEEEQK